MNANDEYLGDGVYASFDGYQIWLTVDRSTGPEQVALEPAVYAALVRYRNRIYSELVQEVEKP